MKEGWICPRCGRVNAPFIGWCNCKPDEVVSNASCNGKHEREIISGGGNQTCATMTFRCKKCGVVKSEICNWQNYIGNYPHYFRQS